MRLTLIALMLAGCQVPTAITFPLPDGHSFVVNVWGADECTPVHEAVHQRQIREWGTSVFLAKWAWEAATMDEERCGSVELPAYRAQWRCMAEKDPPLTEDDVALAQNFRCPGRPWDLEEKP